MEREVWIGIDFCEEDGMKETRDWSWNEGDEGLELEYGWDNNNNEKTVWS
jgi:hypothetical protein